MKYRLVHQNRAKFVARAGGPGRMLIFGLGNMPYPKSRHSVGQLIIDGLAARFGTRLAYEPRLQSFYGSVEGLEMPGSPNNKRLKLSFAKTKNYMNLSGPWVKKTSEEALHNTQTFHPRNRRIIIIHDSIDQAPMKISPRFGGSANGHNGVRSVIAALGTQDFYRIRIGVGKPERGMLEQYVLERLSQQELDYWSPGGEGIEKIWGAIENIIKDEIEVGKEEYKQNPKKDLPQFAAVPASVGYRSHKRLQVEKTLPQKLQQAQQTPPSNVSRKDPELERTEEKDRSTGQENALADQLARIRLSSKK